MQINPKVPSAIAQSPGSGGQSNRGQNFSYNPQDGTVMSPDRVRLEGVEIVGTSVSSQQVRLKDGLLPVDGAYVYDPDDRRYYAANAFAAVSKALDVFQKAYGEPIQWATGRARLDVTSDAGKMLNAYYSRQDGGLFFWHETDPRTKEVVYSAASGEVVAHEAGHAILDAIRPNYFSAWSPDPGAFHESFGDVLAMLVSLKDERVLEKVVEQTGGDMSRPNLAAALGEQLGRTINHTAGKNVTGGDYTRNAINKFVWQDPNSLPESGPPDQLTPEVHNFSRLWTGAYYEVFQGIVQQKLTQGISAKDSIASATDESLKMLARMMKTAPEGDFTYKDMATALIRSENSGNAGRYTPLIEKVFKSRKILPDSSEQSLRASDLETPVGSRTFHGILKGDHFGPLQGCKISTVLSGFQASVADESDYQLQRLERDIARLYRNGDILLTEPNQVVTTDRLFKPNGEPYVGVVRWIDGQMSLERVAIGH